MSKVLTDNKHYTDIAAAIREKNGTDDKYKPAEMADAIAAIETGGGGGDLPEEAFNITGNCSYRFSNNGWNWFVEEYGNKINTYDINSITYMFYNSNRLNIIPFEINCWINSPTSLSYMYYECKKLKELPKLNNVVIMDTSGVMSYFVYGCQYLREIPDDYFDDFDFSKITNAKYGFYYLFNGNVFTNCYSLRKIPLSVMKYENPISTGGMFASLFSSCYCLDALSNVPLPLNSDNIRTSNMFVDTVKNCQRLKELTFELDETGVAKKQSWKSQTIDTSYYVGYSNGVSYITNYNSGITADKEVKDDATYQALKNDNDWFTGRKEYSRYNRTSAVNTINSLPDTSEYLSTAGGTNTIKFLGASGSLTDGGAINTMTEEEIAVATAKGWTVTFS